MSTSSTNNEAKKRKATCDDGDNSPESNDALRQELRTVKAKLLHVEKELVDAKAVNESLQARVTSLQDTANSAEVRSDNDTDSKDDEGDDDDDSVVDNPKDPWNAKFLLLLAFRIREGHCKVPRSDPTLGQWVNNQRRAFSNVRNGKKGIAITPERIARLESLGFSWGKNFGEPVSWETRFEELQQYHTVMGNCDVPVNSQNPSVLGKWLSSQRQEYKYFKKGRDSLLTLEQIQLLKELGFKWKFPRVA